MKFTKVPPTLAQELQLNAGVLLSSFNPASAEYLPANIIGATSGGINFSAVSSFKDFGEDVDNCPKNTKEMKKLEAWEVKMSGTFASTTTALAKMLLAAADIDTTDTTKVTPRKDIHDADFTDIWWVGDYSDKNGNSNGGFIAIHMMNALSSAGFSIQTANDDKGKFAFEFTAHYSMNAQDTVPYELYIKAGTAEPSTVTLTYDANGGTGTMTDSNSPYSYGASVTVKTNTFAKSGATFQHWNTAANDTGTQYSANDTFNIQSNTTLYAIWSN